MDLETFQYPYHFTHDVVFHGWVSSLLCEQVLDVVEASKLDTLIVRRTAYFDFLSPKQQLADWNEFCEGLHSSRLSLVPANEPGRIRRRFWETLSMGRIPVLVDDQAILPLQDRIDWHSIILHVPETKVAKLPDILARYLAKNDDIVLQYRGRMARQIWCRLFKEVE